LSEVKLVRITYKWTVLSDRKPNENEAELRLRYSDGSTELVDLLPGEFLDVEDLPVIHVKEEG
jgi:hypothetical protein